MSKIRPILFNTDMVRAILDGRKTVTRRVMKPQIPDVCPECMHIHADYIYDRIAENIYCAICGEPLQLEVKPSYQPGDILYVRETWQHGYGGTYLYKASAGHDLFMTQEGKIVSNIPWRSSIHMPKEAARIWLKVTDVRVERLQDITEEQVDEEGFRFKPPCLTLVSADGHCCDLDGPCTSKIKYCDMSMGELFGKELWNSTIKKADVDRYGWDANPWVWVIEFEQCEKPREVCRE